MRLFQKILFTITVFLAGYHLRAQETLPDFTVIDKGGGRVIISWRNPYPNLIQLSVQRSYDSLKRFGTVYSSTSPELPVNGYNDKVPDGVKVFYRIFYVMEGGAYFFTASKTPVVPEELVVTPVDEKREELKQELQQVAEAKTKKELVKEVYDPNKPLYLKESDTTDYRILLLKDFRAYRDSIMNQTKDTLVQRGKDTLLIKPYDPPFAKNASKYVFTSKDGYLVIKLDDFDKKKYQVVIMEEDETPVVELRQIKDAQITLDKSIFYKSGWYKFTLRENGRIKEKGKVFLPKDF